MLIKLLSAIKSHPLANIEELAQELRYSIQNGRRYGCRFIKKGVS